MADSRSRALTLFNRTAHFNWAALEAEHGGSAVVDYCRFLAIKVLDDDLDVGEGLRHAPGGDVDKIWHSHMLRASHYAAVCAALTRSREALVDHDPAMTRRSVLAMRTARTARRMEEQFARPSTVDAPNCKRESQSNSSVPGGREKRQRSTGNSMHVTVMDVDGESETFKLQPSDTIGYLKGQIEERIGVPHGHHTLLYNIQQMLNTHTLADYGVENNSTIDLLTGQKVNSNNRCSAASNEGSEKSLEGNGNSMQITVRHAEGKTETINVLSSDALKTKVAQALGMAVGSFRMFYNGRRLEEGTVAGHNIENNSTIDWMVNMLGC